MQTIRCLALVLTLVVTGRAAHADDDPPVCKVTKIKNDAVSIEIPLRGNLVSEVHCRNDAMKAAKEYAAEHQTCDPKKKIEKTFQLAIDFGTRAKHKSFTMTTGCPK